MNPVENHLIERLPRRERTQLLSASEPCELVPGDMLYEAGTPTEYVHFPTDGFISLASSVDAHPGLAMALVGREGMVGANLVLGVANSPLGALVQRGGSSRRVGAAEFAALLAQSPLLLRELLRYLHVSMAQTVASAGCLHFHLIAARLARWLLMSQDRAHGSQFHVTHEAMAQLLGVRRVGVTVAASELQRQGLISYHRGELTVLDRSGLEAAACSCYAADRAVYAAHLC